ncbi:MAG: MerR family transcriptional regulator [Actinomycetota bacterium]|nr:MerR family transcriptional regulator [Actinomycetota bacterium]
MTSARAASRTGSAGGSTLTIGDVLSQLRPDFPDLTISKIRFLEDAGLIRPERTASGYRKFSAADVSRLRYVLSQQRDHYLPLKVIKEQLEAIDRGLVAPGGAASPRVPHVAIAEMQDNAPTAEHFRPPQAALRLSREELLNAAGLRPNQLGELEQFGLISKKPGGHYDDDALAVGKIVADLARFGLEGRHLRTFRTAAEREVGLFSQVVGPMSRQRSSEARVRAEETVRELAALSVRLHAALVQIGLREVVGGG